MIKQYFALLGINIYKIYKTFWAIRIEIFTNS